MIDDGMEWTAWVDGWMDGCMHDATVDWTRHA